VGLREVGGTLVGGRLVGEAVRIGVAVPADTCGLTDEQARVANIRADIKAKIFFMIYSS